MRLDLHVHTKHSRDGMSSPAKMVKAAKARGLDGLAITDHNTTRAWGEALAVARKLGLELILGEEIKVFSGGNKRGEILALFLQEEIPPGDFHKVMDRIREQGASPHEAITQGGALRFRAVILTSLTTFAGLTPMILERSLQAQFLIPMAVSLGFGVLFATGVTLLLVPCGYMILEDLHNLVGKLKVRIFGRETPTG